MNKLPQVRNENIVVQNLKDEVLIYFFDGNKAVCLNSTSAIVFNHCNGKTTFDELKNKYKFTDDLIYFTLDKLNENNLLKEYQANNHFAGLSRRDVIKRIGLGSMITLPVISGIIAPTATHAASGGLALGANCAPAGSVCAPGGVCAPTQGTNGTGTSGNIRCCIDGTSIEPGLRAGAGGSQPTCNFYGPSCCTGQAVYNGTACFCATA